MKELLLLLFINVSTVYLHITKINHCYKCVSCIKKYYRFILQVVYLFNAFNMITFYYNFVNQVFGNDPVACLFSRDWKHRECGLRFVSRKVVRVLTERRSTTSYKESRWELLKVCAAVLAHIMADPVYSVYVAALVRSI